MGIIEIGKDEVNLAVTCLPRLYYCPNCGGVICDGGQWVWGDGCPYCSKNSEMHKFFLDVEEVKREW